MASVKGMNRLTICRLHTLAESLAFLLTTFRRRLATVPAVIEVRYFQETCLTLCA